MCIIFYNEFGAKYDEGELRNAHNTNDDGVGIMWLEDGKVNVFTAMASADELVTIMNDSFVGVPHALHLRFATNGPTVAELCHPFKASHEGADRSVWLMHNGVLYDEGNRAKAHESDTQVFANDRAADADEAGSTDVFFEDAYIQYMEGKIGGDKMVFFRDDGDVLILNPENWHVDEETGIWYSNLYSVAPSFSCSTRAYTPSLEDGILPAANKSAADSASVFTGENNGHEDSCVCVNCVDYLDADATGEEDPTIFLKWDGDAFAICSEADSDIEVPRSDYFAFLEEPEDIAGAEVDIEIELDFNG